MALQAAAASRSSIASHSWTGNRTYLVPWADLTYLLPQIYRLIKVDPSGKVTHCFWYHEVGCEISWVFPDNLNVVKNSIGKLYLLLQICRLTKVKTSEKVTPCFWYHAVVCGISSFPFEINLSAIKHTIENRPINAGVLRAILCFGYRVALLKLYEVWTYSRGASIVGWKR